MNCKDYADKINAYIDGLLTQDEKELLEKHASACKECGKQLASLGNARLSLLSLKKMPARPGFEAAVMAKIGSVTPAPSFFEAFFSAAKAAILVSLFVFCIITAFDYFTPAVAASAGAVSKTSDNGIAALNRYVLQSSAVDMRNEKLVMGR